MANSVILLLQNLILHFLGHIRHKPRSNEFDAQGKMLKEDNKGQSDGQNEPELLRQVVVMLISVVPVPGVGKYPGQESGV